MVERLMRFSDIVVYLAWPVMALLLWLQFRHDLVFVALCAGGLMTSTGLNRYAHILQSRYEYNRLPQEERERIERERIEEERERELYSAIYDEAKRLQSEIPKHLAIQNRMQYERRRGSRTGDRKKITLGFEWIGITKTEIWFRFDGRPGKMPYGTSFSDLTNPGNHVLDNIQYGIGRPCRWKEDNQFNLFLRVGLKNSLMGIPTKIRWEDVRHKLPKKRHLLPIGVNENNKMVYEDYRKFPHVLVAGATDQGKSTLLLQWLLTLVTRNKPEQLQLVLVDLKHGVELSRFSELPHVIKFDGVGVLDSLAGASQAFDWLMAEHNRRAEMFQGVCQNIIGWNKQKPNRRLPYIILVIDEMADLMLEDRDVKKLTIKAGTTLARKARMSGIHLWFCTQIIEAAVLPLQIRGNFPARLVFSVPGYDESRLVIGNGMAAGLEPRGRCVYKRGSRISQLQVPIAKNKTIDAIIAEFGDGTEPEPVIETGVTELDVLRVALHNFGGDAAYRGISEVMRGEFHEKNVKQALKDFQFDENDPDGSVIELDGERYILSPPGVLSRSRKLLQINGAVPQSIAEIEERGKRRTNG